MLQLASVVGKDVSLPLLRAIAEVPEQDLQSCLAHLQTAEFMYETRLFPEPEYTFRHALTLEVAYGSLLQERRRELHARIVETLERLYPERMSEQARDWPITPSAPRSGPRPWRISRSRARLRPPARASTPSSGRRGSAESADLWWNGEYARAIEVGQRDLAIAADFRNFDINIVSDVPPRPGSSCARGLCRGGLSFRRVLASLQGDLQREHFGMAGLPSVFARAWSAWCLAELGDFPEGIALGEEGVAIADAADHAYSQVLAAWGLGTLHRRAR